MKKERVLVWHVKQKVFEYYYGAELVSPSVAGDWERGSWYVRELIHSMPVRKDGTYGQFIKW